MLTEIDGSSIATRRLILRDSLGILSLVLVTVSLFLITLFLFRSFSAHRVSLAQSWYQQGQRELQEARPAEAVEALRTALSYAPGTRAYELLLAQALGDAGHTEESYNYFMGLWETEPGNGPINLQLARLAAKRNDRPAAVNFYRASIYGTWEGDGVARRAEVRTELARYLIDTHDPVAARLELLIAGGNAPESFDLDMTLADLLQQAGDPADAWNYYQKALAMKPGDPAALEAAGRLAYDSGDFQNAHRLLERAQVRRGRAPQNADDLSMMNNAARILELIPSPNLPPRESIANILAARAIARKRFDSCSAEFAGAPELPAALETLGAQWNGPEGTADTASLLRDASQREASMQLVYDTEVQTGKLCSAATGDDALLLKAATTRTNPPLEAGRAAQADIPHD